MNSTPSSWVALLGLWVLAATARARDAGPPADAQPGFDCQRRKAGQVIAPIRRGDRQGYRLMRMTLGQDLPLGEEIRCSVVFSSWLLDKPSELYLVPVGATATR